MSFGALNVDITLQISNKILFEKSFGDALSIIASEWWDELQISRLDQGKRKVRSCNHMKRILQSEFIPLNYCLV